MEQPKVRFTKTDKTKIGRGENKEKDFNDCQQHNKEKLKIKSIVPVNFPLKVLKSGRRVLAQSTSVSGNSFQSQDRHHKKYSLAPSTSNGNVEPAKLSRSQPPPDKSCFEHLSSSASGSEISNSELYTNQCSRNEKDNSYPVHLEHCMHKLQKVTIGSHSTHDQPSLEKSENHANKRSNGNVDVIEKNTKPAPIGSLINKRNKTNENCNINGGSEIFNVDDNDEDDIQVLKIVNTSQNLSHNKQNNKQNSESKSENKIVRTGNKENNSKQIVSHEVVDKPSSTVTSSILKDSTNASSTNIKNKGNTKVYSNNRFAAVMPCAKFRIPLVKNHGIKQVPETQIKKKILYNVIGEKRNVSVQPGPSLKNLQCKTDDVLPKDCERKSIVSKDILSHPEYNSTVNTMKKLKEIKNEKCISNTVKLPSAYKHSINEKVTTALEFSPCESIYKDLINLSEEDDKFSARIVRNKYPEPRNKDIVPDLSDYYRPKFTGECFTIVNPIVKEPINVNNMNAFKINNKIVMWKVCRDIDHSYPTQK